MAPKLTRAAASICILLFLCGCTTAQLKPLKRPMLLANYYVWYHSGKHQKQPHAGWTRPTQKKLAPDAKRYGKTEIASACYPLAGLYDSHDIKVAEWHVKLAKAAGIDGFLVSWWENHLGRDKAFENGILAAAARHNFKVALLDERAQFHKDLNWYKASLTKALARFKDSPAYLKIDGKPVVYLYQVATNASLTPAKFTELKTHVEKVHGPVYWIVDKIAHNHSAAKAGKPDQIKHIPKEWLATPGIDCFGFYSTFSNFRACKYEELIGKFRHITKQAHKAGKKMLVPVHPGHDNTRYSETPYVMPRRNGQTLKDYLRAGEDAGADIIMVTSWNEWPESTVVEPSVTWKDPYQYLKILAKWKGVEFEAPPMLRR